MNILQRILLFIIITLSFRSMAQDERAFRDLLTHKLKKDHEIGREEVYAFKARGHRYFLDLNEDGAPESFFTSKKDGGDWIEIFDDKGAKIYDFKFDTLGSWSRIFKVQMRKISNKSKVLLFYFYEGLTRFNSFQATARVYFLSWDNNELNTFSMFKGPYTWDEQRTFRGHYHQRKFEVSMFDFDDDLQREVAVRYGTITRVYKYLGKGRWGSYGI